MRAIALLILSLVMTARVEAQLTTVSQAVSGGV